MNVVRLRDTVNYKLVALCVFLHLGYELGYSALKQLGTLLQASAACCIIASKVTAVSQFSSISNSVYSKLSPNSSKTRYTPRGVRPQVACRSSRDDVDCAITELSQWKDASSEPAEVNLWQQKGGQVLALVLATLQAVAPIPLDGALGEWGASPAEAVLYSPDTKVPRSAEVALRRAIPAVNASMKKMQESLEDIFYLLRIPQRKPYGKSPTPCFKLGFRKCCGP